MKFSSWAWDFKVLSWNISILFKLAARKFNSPRYQKIFQSGFFLEKKNDIFFKEKFWGWGYKVQKRF